MTEDDVDLNRVAGELKQPAAPASDVRLCSSTTVLDPLEARFRLDSVWAGAWVTIVVCVPALIYALSDPRATHRTVFVWTLVIGLAGGVLAFALPWRRIIRSRWREPAFLTWTAIDMLLIAVAAIADGGPTSPVATLFLIPLVFVGASYPRWSVLLVSILALSTYTIAAAAWAVRSGRFILGLSVLVGVALMSVWQARNHERRQIELARISKTDPLTGCLNRRGAADAARAALGAVARFDQPFTVILIDLDDFKAYNDVHGHAAGDALLCWLTDRITRQLRPTDALARLGGDEFAVLMAGVDAPNAAPTAARIRQAIEGRAPHCSGIASAPRDGTDIDALYHAADQALYDQKRARSTLLPRRMNGAASRTSRRGRV